MKKYILILVCAAFLVSCNQNLLDVVQYGVESIDTYYAEADDNEALNLAATLYRSTFDYTSVDYMARMAEFGDEVTSWPRDETTWCHCNSENMNAQNHPMNSFFQYYYQLVYRCNMIIENLPEDSEVKKLVIGSAYYFRAWAYVNLIRGWGTPPLVDHVLAADELQPANGKPEDLWNFVFVSLEEAIKRLPAKKSLGGEFQDVAGYVSKQGAQGLLGKAYLLSGDYTKAESTLKEIINSGLYKLNPDIAALWRPKADWCDEYLWEWNVADNDDANMMTEGASDRRLYFSWASEMTMPGTAWRQGKTQWGYMHAVTRNMANFLYDRGEYGKPRWMATVWDYSQLLQKWEELEGDSIETADSESGLMWLQKGSPVVGCSGLFRSKFYIYKEDLFESMPRGSTTQYSKANWPGMRYAEVLLLYAEAVAGHDSDGLGLKGLNDIRERAGLNKLSSYTLQDVKDEKRAELFCENERYYDLIRWGDAPTVLVNRYPEQYSFYGYVEGTDPHITGREAWSKYNITVEKVTDNHDFIVGRDECFPFPYTEIQQNPNLKQNPGW